MKKIVKVLIVIGLLGGLAAGISVLIRNNSSNSQSPYSESSTNENKTTISQIYTGEETIYF